MSLVYKRKLSMALLGAVLLLFSGVSSALALPDSARAMAAFSEKDPTFFYVGLADARQFAGSMGRSELVRLLVDLRPDYEFFRSFLKDFPAKDFTLMLSDTGEHGVTFQLAIAFGEDKRAILDKIAARTAAASDIVELLGGEAFLLDVLDLYVPESEDEFYEFTTFDLYFSSFENLLILGSHESAVERSIAAGKNRFRRQKFDFKGKDDNVLFVRIGEEISSEIFGPETQGHVYFEGDIARVPGGWDMELHTNVVNAFYGERYVDMSYEKKPGTFFNAGGGLLVAAVDSTPDLKRLFGLRGPMADIGRGIDEMMAMAAEKLGKNRAEELGNALMTLDRLNLAVTMGDGGPSDLRSYAFLSSREEGESERLGKLMSELIEVYNDSPEAEDRFESIDLPGWSRSYALSLPEEAPVFTNDSRLVLAFGPEGLFAGLMPDALVETRFGSDSELYEKISNTEDVVEVVYLDMRALRKIAKLALDSAGIRRQGRQMLAAMTIPLIDMREIGLQTHAIDHFSLQFRTGWLDFEERDFVWSLLR